MSTKPITAQIGNATVSLTPHYLPDVGAQLFFTTTRPLENLSADNARLLANLFKAAACEAEALERRYKQHHPRAA